MLCDQIVRDKFLPIQYVGFNRLQGKIDAAQKFILSPDFTAAADGLVDNIQELTRIAPFCRLPFPLTWIEFAQNDRPKFCNAEMKFPEFQFKPSRIGFLMEAEDNTMACWHTWLLWNIKHGGLEDNNVSLLTVGYNTANDSKKLEDVITTLGMVDFADSVIRQFPDKDIWETMANLMRSDWAGEIRYLISVLGLLNARNVAMREPVDKTAHNAKRFKARQLPLFSHTILKLRPAHKPTMVRGASGDLRAEVRSHFVSGHFKARRTGLFFWGPHMRGRAQAGFVEKDYLVEAK
jgi:hypothetical protein